MSPQQQQEGIEPRKYLVQRYTRRLTISTRGRRPVQLVLRSRTLAEALSAARAFHRRGAVVWIERDGHPASWTA